MSGTAVTGVIGSQLGSTLAGTFGWTASTWSQIGWTAGVLVGTYLFAEDGPEIITEGSRLDDLKVVSSAYGIDIQKVYGAYRTSGNIIWALPINETRHEETQEEGKGGGGATSTNIWYTYDATFAVAICEGAIAGIRKIWFDSILVYDNGVYGGALNANNHTIYKGTSYQQIDWSMQADNPDTPAYRNIAYAVFRGIQLKDSGNRIPNVTFEVINNDTVANLTTPMYLSSVVEKILIESGLKSTDYNLSSGDTVEISGYRITKSMSGRNAIEPLLSAYDFILVENEHTIELRKAQYESVITVSEIDLGANTDNNIEYNIKQEQDLIRKLTVKYANSGSDYKTGVQSIRRINVAANSDVVIELPLALTDDQAKQLAEKNIYKNWLSRETFSFNLSFEYKDLIAGDVVNLNFNGRSQDVRITSINITPDNILNISGVASSYNVYTSTAIGSLTNGNGADIKEDVGITELQVLDIPTLKNSYLNSEGFYLAVTSDNDGWKGAYISYQLLGNANLVADITMLDKTPIGDSTTALPSGITHVWDRTNTVTVNCNQLLESVTEAEVLNGLNYILIGSEILQYSTAIDNLDGTYTLSTLLRGRLGTESKVGTHAIGDVFVFLSRLSLAFTYKAFGSTYEFAAESIDSYPTNYDVKENLIQKYNSGQNLKPYSIWYPRVFRQVDDDIDVTWMRRSRYITGYMKYVPLAETVEQYKVDVYNDSGYVNTYITTIPSFLYNSTKATADSQTLTDNFFFHISQFSSIYGYGDVTIIEIESSV